MAAVRRAAEIQGRSISDFVVAAAKDAAERAIERAQIVQLSLADQERLANALLAPAPTAPALDRAFEAHRELIRESR